jgi:hypothetical protein
LKAGNIRLTERSCGGVILNIGALDVVNIVAIYSKDSELSLAPFIDLNYRKFLIFGSGNTSK